MAAPTAAATPRHAHTSSRVPPPGLRRKPGAADSSRRRGGRPSRASVPTPAAGPAAQAGQDPTEHARPLAAASGRSRASGSGRAGAAQVRGPGAGLPLRPHTLQGPAGLRSATLDELEVGVGNFLGQGHRGEGGNGELPARRVCRLERRQLKTPERCLQISGLLGLPLRASSLSELQLDLQSRDLANLTAVRVLFVIC
ncbi:hypothetical protein AB1E18_006436 [Capra hircus]